MAFAQVVKPVSLVAGTLASPGTLSSVLLFTVVAAAELLLNDRIFACPCGTGLPVVYGLSFLIVPAIILFLADFPWKLVRTCASPGVICSFIRRPIGLGVTWIVLGFLQRKYVDCILEEENENCERSVRASWFQLLGLYIWLILVTVSFVMVLCRRQRMSCMSGRNTALEMQIKYEMEERQERVDLERNIKYGAAKHFFEENLSLDALQTLAPALNKRTYAVLSSEQLLQPSVLSFLREEDLLSLDVPIAQRCVLRSLLSSIREDPSKLNW